MNKPSYILVKTGAAAFTLAAASAMAQGDIPSGTLSDTGTGPYNYTLTFSDSATATSPIGSVWYSWVPGSFYLPSSPTSATAPSGWTAHISGDSVQYVATSSVYDIQPGGSLSGFDYSATFSPAQLAAAPNSGVSVSYTSGLFSDSGEQFTVQAPVSTPEPSSLATLATGIGALLSARHLFKGRRSSDSDQA